MKKIPTLFERVYENHKIVDVLPNVTAGMEWVLAGEGVATVKVDGSCCAIINGELYKRYDAKKGKKVPEGAIKCQDEADAITGHLPCWVKCDRNNPADKWFWAAYDSSINVKKDCKILSFGTTKVSLNESLPDTEIKTYEAVGEHFQGNPYNLSGDMLVRHGEAKIEVERTYEGIRDFLSENYIEGIVFWKDGEPKCKIKRSDFGFAWNK